MSPHPSDPPAFVPRAVHRRRLRELWRSAGWPCRDPLEAELLAAGLLASRHDDQGRETVHLTAAGVALLADTLQRNRALRDEHEALVARVAREMQRAGRIVWRGLALRAWVSAPAEGPPADLGLPAAGPDDGALAAPGVGAAAAAPTVVAPLFAAEPVPPSRPDGRWAVAMPDVFSVRLTTVEAYLAPVAHEVKVRRADLLADLRRPAKGEAYRWLAGECWYVIKQGIARPEEIPPVYGVLVAPPTGPLEVARPAPARAMRLPFAVWMALARAVPEPEDLALQAPLGGAIDPDGGAGTG